MQSLAAQCSEKVSIEEYKRILFFVAKRSSRQFTKGWKMKLTKFMRKIVGQTNYKFIKIFGERNTGTNFLNQLVERNTRDIEILEHGKNKEIRNLLPDFPEKYHEFVDERMRDHLRIREFKDNFGFKHAVVSPSYLKASPKFANTIFIFISRNPFYFINSLYRRPYSIIPDPRDGKCMDDFLRQKILFHQRDNTDFPIAKSPVHLWSIKTGAAWRTHNSISNSIFIKYEELVNDPGEVLKRLKRMGVATTDEVDIPKKSTKGDAVDFFAYRRKTLGYNPKSDFNESQIEYILSEVDRQLCCELNYPTDVLQ